LKQTKIYENKNNIDDRPGRNLGRQRPVGCHGSRRRGGHGHHQPQSPLLHLPDASVSERGQARRLPDLRHDIAAGLCKDNGHELASGSCEHEQTGSGAAQLLFDGRRRMLSVGTEIL